MQFLIVDIDLAELGTRALAHLRLQRFSVVFVLQRRAHFHDASLFDEVRKVERGLLDTALALQILRHGN